MASLVITRGLPGVGKTTVAKSWVADDPEKRCRINRDDLRQMLHGGVYIKGSADNRGTEKTIIDLQLAMVRRALREDRDVIVDDTSLPSRTVRELFKVAEPLGVTPEILDFTDVALEEVLRRDAGRDNPVGEDVIRGLHERFIKGKPYPLPFEYTPKPELAVEKYLPDLQKPRAIIVDVDGTVARMEDRQPFEWEKVGTDRPVWPIIKLVDMLRTEHRVIFLSGRKDVCRDTTWMWLHTNVMNMDHAELFMRRADDNRPDDIVKLEIFNREIRENYNVRYALDDRNQVVAMWRKLGITCLQVADGDF